MSEREAELLAEIRRLYAALNQIVKEDSYCQECAAHERAREAIKAGKTILTAEEWKRIVDTDVEDQD